MVRNNFSINERRTVEQDRITVMLEGMPFIYTPSTGKIIWRYNMKYSIEHDAVRWSRGKPKGYVIDPPSRQPILAARFAYSAVHGDIPEYHEAYCLDGDDANLRISNLAIREVSRTRKTLYRPVLEDSVRFYSALLATETW